MPRAELERRFRFTIELVQGRDSKTLNVYPLKSKEAAVSSLLQLVREKASMKPNAELRYNPYYNAGITL